MNCTDIEKLKGIDLLVWMDAEGDILLQAITGLGIAFLFDNYEGYMAGDHIQIDISPEELAADVPPSIGIGCMMNGLNKVFKLPPASLH